MDKKERVKKPMKKGAKWALVIFIWGFSAYFLVALSGFIAAGVSDFDEFRAKNAYHTVESLKGKILFLLHEKDSLEMYMQRDPDMQKSAMNIALEYAAVLKKGKDYSRFSFTVVLNDPTKHKDRIAQAINRDNYIVRTRLDRYAVRGK